MKWLRYFSYALVFICAYLLFTPPRYQYSNAELTRLYGLEGKDPALVAKVLPPPPHRYPRWLARQSDPLMRKSVKDLTDREIDMIVFRAAERLHAFWTREFTLRGGTYVPVEIIPEWAPLTPGPREITALVSSTGKYMSIAEKCVRHPARGHPQMARSSKHGSRTRSGIM